MLDGVENANIAPELKEYEMVATEGFYQMMRTRTKTEIIIEKRERTTIRWRHQRIVWCAPCAAQVCMVTPNEAAATLRACARGSRGNWRG